MGEFCMPSLGADMERGTLLEWRVQVGDRVHRGEIIAVVDTDKSDVEVEVFEDGVVTEILVEEGEEVPVGTPLARLDTVDATTDRAASPAGQPPASAPADEAPGADAPATEPPPPPAPARPSRVVSPIVRRLAEQEHVDLAAIQPGGADGVVHRADVERAAASRDQPPTAPDRSPTGAPARPGDRTPASPYARRLAAERGADLTDITGSGPGGAVVARDLTAAPSPPASGPDAPTPAAPTPAAPARRDKAAATRRAIAHVMARSKREIPHFYLANPIDLAAASHWIEDINADRPPDRRILPAALLLKATALAARKVPGVNGYWLDDAFQPASRIDLGVAIGLRGGGVVTPAIAAADTLALDELMARLRDLVERARLGSIRSTETDGSLTVTNLGDQGVATVYGVINPPQVALVGFGAIAERPVAHDGMLAAHLVVDCTLSADHRAVDGHLGSRFLRTIDQLLQQPDRLVPASQEGPP